MYLDLQYFIIIFHLIIILDNFIKTINFLLN